MTILILALCSLILTCHATSISNEGHFAKNGQHDPDFIHEAFVGKYEAKIFGKLTPDESKEKLQKLFHKVDVDADGFVTEDELKKWFQHIQNRYSMEDYNKQMKQKDLNNDGYVTWEEYKKAMYGYLDENEDEKARFQWVLQRDEKRFKLADNEGDMKLKLDEFSAFLHPEKHDHMKAVVVEETLEDIDKDKDGFIDLEEYIGDVWPEEDRDEGVEPAWVKAERVQFSDIHDKNKDDKLDAEEVQDWIMPTHDDNIISEAKHLVSESDTDGDGVISNEEMVEKYDLFVGSRATDFGEILKLHHQEL